MNVTELFAASVARKPREPALVWTERGLHQTVTFGGLNHRVGQAAGMLRQHGLESGDTVLVCCSMSVELYVALRAILALGLVAMFIEPSASRGNLARTLARHPPRAMISDARIGWLALLNPAARRINLRFCIGRRPPGAIAWSSYRRLQAVDEVVQCDDSWAALISITSGSTGAPKAALRTHGFLRTQLEVLRVNYPELEGSELVGLPLFVLANLANGLTSIIPDADMRRPGAVDPGRLVAQIRRLEPVGLTTGPAFLSRLVAHCSTHRETLPELDRIRIGGGPIFPDLLAKLAQVAPRARVTAVYGSTEAEPIAHVCDSEIATQDIAAMWAGRGLLLGRPVDAARVRILPDRWGAPIGPFTAAEFDRAALPVHTAGEITVSGAHVLRGYLDGIGDADTKFRVDGIGWHRTGDAGYLDERGRLWLLGRCSARISAGDADSRGTLYPLGLETRARRLPEVRASALCARGAQRILAVEPRCRLSPGQAARLRRRLLAMGIDEVQFVRRIPMDRRHNAKGHL